MSAPGDHIEVTPPSATVDDPEPCSQTATDYINAQERLEADAREALPYSFKTCTYPLGSIRQSVFACLTCNPPPASPAQSFTPAGVCYSCSISCHGEHTLVELFAKRNFTCDCGTTRFINQARCTLRADPATEERGVHSQEAAKSNRYNQNFQGKFCGCGEEYDPHTEKGTMFQCLGLGTVETGGCGEDWWHPECVVGLPRDWAKNAKSDRISENHNLSESTNLVQRNEGDGDDDQSEREDEPPMPPGFPQEDDFDTFICYKCVESNAWIKAYAGTEGFLPPVLKNSDREATNNTHDPRPELLESGNKIQESTADQTATKNGKLTAEEPQPVESDTTQLITGQKRKASPSADERPSSPSKRVKEDTPGENADSLPPKHASLPSPPTGPVSVFCTSTFRTSLCHCPACFPHLLPHPQVLEEEDTYSPPLSRSSSPGPNSEGSRSLYDRGEAALNTIDRVRAIEGVMAYNHLKDKVKEFLKPYAESGVAVGAEDVKKYFEGLREAEGSKAAETKEEAVNGDNRREERGY
ncbi:MAG: hypothetical protein Q9227_003838 [Pyrenula ochraceoflavens]